MSTHRPGGLGEKSRDQIRGLPRPARDPQFLERLAVKVADQFSVPLDAARRQVAAVAASAKGQPPEPPPDKPRGPYGERSRRRGPAPDHVSKAYLYERKPKGPPRS